MSKNSSHELGGATSISLSPLQMGELELLLKGLLNRERRFLNRAELSQVLKSPSGISDLGAYPVTFQHPETESTDDPTRVVLRDAEGAPLGTVKVDEVWSPESVGAFMAGAVETIELPARCLFEELRVGEAPDGCGGGFAYFTEGLLHPRELSALAERAEGRPLVLFALGGWQQVDSAEALRVRCLQHALEYWSGSTKLQLVPWPRSFSSFRNAAIWSRIAHQLGCNQLAWRESGATQAGDESDRACKRFVEELFGTDYFPVAAELSPSMQQCREALLRGDDLPEVYPELVGELRSAYGNRFAGSGVGPTVGGVTILLTGLSGAGKSTLARGLASALSLQDRRPVTLLDGDVVRRHLSSELGFSKEHRDLNVRRIGFVAAEITKNGGCAICAPIAPYEETRRRVRQHVESVGTFVEVHVATTLEECEARDRKGLYERARRGEITQFTGIDDPYEIPADPEIRIHTGGRTPRESLNELLGALEKLGVCRTGAPSNR